MAKTRYLEYQIHLTDRAVVTARQAEFPTGIRVAPATAAATYAAPIQPRSQAFSAPCCRSPYFWGPGFPAIANYPQDEATFTRKVGGWFGIPLLFGTTVNHIWVGKFVFGSGAVGEIDGVPTEVVAIAKRRWATGFEIPVDGDTPSGGTSSRTCTRDASRHPDGLGWAYRKDTGDLGNAMTRWVPGSTARFHWDRFYVRVRRAPDTAARIWMVNGGNVGSSSGDLKLTPSLQLVFSNISSGAETIFGSSSQSLVLNTWAKIDIVFSFATAGGGVGAYAEVWVNGVRVINIPNFGSVAGMGFNGAYTQSSLGSLGNTTLEADFDDWIGAELPVKDSLNRYAGLDWLNGSKVQRLMGTSFGTGHDAVNWTNQSYSNLNQYPETNLPGTSMVSTTAAAGLVLNTDAKQKIDNQVNALGIAYLQVIVYHNALTAGAHTLGFKIGADPLDLLVQPPTSGLHYQYHYYRPVGLLAPRTPVDPITLHYLKDNDATSDTVFHLGGVAEMIGTFGAEDVFPGVTAPTTIPRRALGAHNNLYPESPWARLATAPAPYVIHSGTYAGNSLGQDLIFRLPVHWLLIRRIDTATYGPSIWFAASLGSSDTLNDQAAPDRPATAFIDPAFVGVGGVDEQEQRTIVRITGAETETNVTGGTYQYIAVSDPLGRFLLTGGLFHGALDATEIDTLPKATFLPETGFFQWLTPNGGSAFKGYFKGLGHAANALSKLDAAETADILSWGVGQITPRDAFTLSATVTASFAVWRRDDGSTETALAKAKCVQMGTYVGDGTASRTVAYGPTGVRPLFLLVQPHNGTSYWRDPGHLGTASKGITGLNNTATAITAGGIDTFSVGSVLNANGITYSWFLLPGSATAGNGGWSIDGEFIPVEPDPPSELCDDPDATNFGELGACVYDPEGSVTCDDPAALNFGELLPCVYDEGPGDRDDCEDGPVCVAATTRQVNLSLLEIGVSQTLTNYCTQTTREAIIATLLYETSVRATLVQTPWAFATKYAALALATAQPSNADWTFSYRLPIDCVFARRLVVSRGTAKDPEPPAFMLSSDASGGLLFTNQAAAVLEYTARPACVALNGDDLFREALKWHLASCLAPPLTRMTEVATRCREEFAKTIEKANAIIKPGVPGLRTAVPLVGDEAAACVTANIQIANRGLLRIGCPTIANLATDQSPPAVLVNIVLEDEIRATLRDYPWKFAKRYDAALVVVAGTATVAANPDWQYSYRLPADVVMVRRLVAEGTGRAFEDSPPPWEVGTDTTGDLLFTDEVDPNLEYTARINCAAGKGDDLFRDALAWRVAAALAPSLAQVDPVSAEQRGRGPEAPTDPRQRVSHKPSQAAMRAQATRYAQAMYRVVLERARVQDANEAEPDDPPDAEWIRGR